MAQIVLITNAWGPKHGGINSFNTDFAKALSPVLAPHTRVTCVVLDATEEVEDAAKEGVRLLSLRVKGSERVDESRAPNVLDAVRRAGTDEVLWWVGHDVISGSAAVALPKLAGQGKSAVIHHMSYVDYTAYKQGSATAAMQKRDQQQQLFRQADEVFAVGPLLRDSLTDLLQGSREVRMLVPGLAEIEPSPSPKTFSAITFGRLDPENDRIKQGRLAIAGFATACREAHANTLYPQVLRDNPRLLVFGVLPSSSEERELRALASSKAGRVLNLLPLPYEEDRARLFEELKRSSIAMMLSWHEGFGLTGWEAIAAEVPLIVSRNSGLYKLIEEKLDASGTACLRVVDVRGGLGDLGNEDTENFHAEDEKGVGQAILELANEIERWKRRAKQLRTLLSAGSDGYTWPNTARSFAEALGLPNQSEVATNHPASYQPTASSAIVPPVAPGGATAPMEQSLLELRDPSWDRERGHAESHLLRPEEACVPFHGSMRQLLDEVLTWAMATDGLPAELQFRVGPAGSGKTRLMLEVCRELRQRGWEAGFLASNLQQNLEKAFKDLLANKPKILVVVDYAETRRREVVNVVREAFTASKEHRVRIVLLARDAGEWWDRLATDYPTLEPFLTGRAVRGPYRLPEVSIAEQGREIVFREALQAFARRLNKDSSSILPPALSTPHFASVLFIHLAAMASLSGERPETATSLLEATLRRERRYWHEAARAQGLPDSLADGVDQAVGMITLCSGVKDTTEARRVLQSTPRLRGASPHEVDQVLTVLRNFYPLAGGVDALRPDILGERLISQELAKDDTLLEIALGRRADETMSRSALTVLNRLARQSRSDVIWLQRGLQDHLTLRADTAITVAIESGDPIGKVLAEVLEQASNSETWKLGEEPRCKMPLETVALRECALVLAQLRVRRLEDKGKLNTRKHKNNLADAYLDLGNRLAALGENQKSLAAYTKALSTFQDLSKSDSKRLRDVSGCLSNISTQLSELDRDTEALQRQQESVKTAKNLVALHQENLSYEILALALNGLSMHLRQNAKLEEAHQSAKEASEIYHTLEKRKPIQYQQEIARVVANIAKTSWELGRDEEALCYAQEMCKIWQELAEKIPMHFNHFLQAA
jgi:glycosyltransferase involved in cell wall biosynthesis